MHLTVFGTTTGLELIQFPVVTIPAEIKLENSWIEITTNQLIVKSDEDSFVIFRKSFGQHTATWIGLYRSAREIGYDRPGGFYGAGVWYVNSVADVKILVDILRSLADQVKSVAMNSNRFTKRLYDSRNEFILPASVSNLTTTLNKISGGCRSEGDSAYIVNNGNSSDLIDWSQRAQSASVFNKIIIGSDQNLSSGTQGSLQVYRSLSLAIEGAYQKVNFEAKSLQSAIVDSDIKISELNNEINYFKNRLDGFQSTLNEKEKEINEYRNEIKKLNFNLNAINTIDKKSFKNQNQETLKPFLEKEDSSLNNLSHFHNISDKNNIKIKNSENGKNFFKDNIVFIIILLLIFTCMFGFYLSFTKVVSNSSKSNIPDTRTYEQLNNSQEDRSSQPFPIEESKKTEQVSSGGTYSDTQIKSNRGEQSTQQNTSSSSPLKSDKSNLSTADLDVKNGATKSDRSLGRPQNK